MPDYRNSPEFHSPTHDPMQRPRQGRDYRPNDPDDAAPAASWLAQLEAGRIGNNPPTSSNVAANRERNERFLRGVFRV
jgi:hypothetical protein